MNASSYGCGQRDEPDRQDRGREEREVDDRPCARCDVADRGEHERGTQHVEPEREPPRIHRWRFPYPKCLTPRTTIRSRMTLETKGALAAAAAAIALGIAGDALFQGQALGLDVPVWIA